MAVVVRARGPLHPYTPPCSRGCRGRAGGGAGGTGEEVEVVWRGGYRPIMWPGV